MISYGSSVAATSTPMTALNTFDVGGNDLAVFYVTQSNKIVFALDNLAGTNRPSYWEGADFRISAVPLTVSGTPTFMTSAVWQSPTASREFAFPYSA